jgi:hypothetical protein
MKAALARRPLERMPGWAKAALAACGISIFLIILALIPVLPIPPYLDFQVLYQVNMGLLRGIPVYDHARQIQLIAALAGVGPEHVRLLPFPYPPWYALTTLWLAWLPIAVAARVWFGINLLLLLASVFLLTEAWSLLRRLPAFALAVLFPPVLGSLLVGQYGFPLLLGAVLMIHALRHERAVLTAVAAALLTFKPHLGGLLIVAVLIHLWQRKDAFGTRALRYTFIAAGLLFFAGFLADPAWPLTYFRSLVGFRSDSDVSSCGLCAGLPSLIALQMGAQRGLAVALVIGITVFVAIGLLWALRRREIIQEPERLMAVSSLIVLLASPYLLNYDFLLLLVPLALLAGEKRGLTGWTLIGILYVAPFLAVGLLGRQGNFIFAICALVLMGLVYRETRPLDVSVGTA